MLNQVKPNVPENNRTTPCPAGGGPVTVGGISYPYVVVSGQPYLFGQEPLVAEDTDFQMSPVTFVTDGSYLLTVIGQSAESPVTTKQINPGDPLFASGTYDPTTGITYGLTIDANQNKIPFGIYEGTSPILAGVTNTAAQVRIGSYGSPFISHTP